MAKIRTNKQICGEAQFIAIHRLKLLGRRVAAIVKVQDIHAVVMILRNSFTSNLPEAAI